MKNVYLVTGANSGIGRAITEYLASMGNYVYAGARNVQKVDELNKINNVTGILLDVTKPHDIKRVIETIEKERGYLDCLVNNAGLMGWGSVIDRDLEYYKSVFDVNIWGVVAMVKAVYPLLKKSDNNPTIFNMSSQGENYTLPFWSPYMMSKHAMKAFSSSLRREMMPFGIRVVALAPGAFKSNMFASQLKDLKEYEKKFNSEFTPKVVKLLGIPIRKTTDRGQSPVIIGKLIHKIMKNNSQKARYQPGRKFFPDVFLEKFPTILLDKKIMALIS